MCSGLGCSPRAFKSRPLFRLQRRSGIERGRERTNGELKCDVCWASIKSSSSERDGDGMQSNLITCLRRSKQPSYTMTRGRESRKDAPLPVLHPWNQMNLALMWPAVVKAPHASAQEWSGCCSPPQWKDTFSSEVRRWYSCQRKEAAAFFREDWIPFLCVRTASGSQEETTPHRSLRIRANTHLHCKGSSLGRFRSTSLKRTQTTGIAKLSADWR